MLGELRALARKEGLVIHPHKTRPYYLRTYGFAPATVFDVGVYTGTPWLYESFPDAHFVLIDPQGDLQGPRPAKGDFHAVAVGAEPGQMTLTIPETKPGQGGAMVEWQAAISAEGKAVRRVGDEALRLYDRRADPGERRPASPVDRSRSPIRQQSPWSGGSRDRRSAGDTILGRHLPAGPARRRSTTIPGCAASWPS